MCILVKDTSNTEAKSNSKYYRRNKLEDSGDKQLLIIII